MKQKMFGLLFVVMLFLSSFAHPNVAQAAVDPVLENAILSTVQLIVTDEQGEPIFSGSGSVISEDGLILTNHHVVEDNPRPDGWVFVLVPTSSRADEHTVFIAETLVVDPGLDLALIRIVADEDDKPLSAEDLSLSFVELGDSDQLEVGENVFALGYPDIASNQLVVTRGLVSGFLQEGDTNWILSDVVISSGNSGGLLINEEGELVGVPTAGRDGETSKATMAYMRPINDALPLIYHRDEHEQADEEPTILYGGEIVEFESATLNERSSRAAQNDLRTLFEENTWSLYTDGTLEVELFVDDEATYVEGTWESNKDDTYTLTSEILEAELFESESGDWYLYVTADFYVGEDEYHAVFYQIVEIEGASNGDQAPTTSESVTVEAGEVVEWVTVTRDGRTDRTIKNNVGNMFEGAIWTINFEDNTFQVVNEPEKLDMSGTFEVDEEDGSLVLTFTGAEKPEAVIFEDEEGNEFVYIKFEFVSDDDSEIVIEFVQPLSPVQ